MGLPTSGYPAAGRQHRGRGRRSVRRLAAAGMVLVSKTQIRPTGARWTSIA
jgi:hypothetical protein